MSGIYIHIPFCKQACHYCDFHFSTSLKKKDDLIEALLKEIQLRKEELTGIVETIYFGGGTPSLLPIQDLQSLIDEVYKHFKVSENPEITLEANPDDVSEALIRQMANSPINRLSIGVQSFFEQDLKLMNRAHNAKEAETCITLAKEHFNNISIDLIYGIPQMSNDRWLANVEKALRLDIPHLSCYALTVEPKTALENFIKKGIVTPVEDDVAQEQHRLLLEHTETAGYRNYEFSNFSKPGWESKNNTAYWQGKPYLGIGPSAHSYDGERRSWNVANNFIYINKITAGDLPLEREALSTKDKYNEYVMTRLRTAGGISVTEVSSKFGEKFKEYLLQQAAQHIKNELLDFNNGRLIVAKKGKFLSDGIASDLFLIELQ
ncbi:radical SAM family heme chaperone HemW [Marinirhabdus gelatinilytica]|uniref:Heme chaperone HemW n=1 Tax=Marinirhabdus gelatinilytica TaxID=1703343 RepID=A0A370QKJ3_9FLAO|nr:radical SAM family heme chaperone HemW [Marinirhabdus gelatinilytica]RDK88888.1 oxygen-independent coproporphyrinogen-3 oxidase [Marinirhabdus gelatinilytica]